MLSYAIGFADPTAVSIDCHGTERVDETAIEDAVMEVWRAGRGGDTRLLRHDAEGGRAQRSGT